MTWITETRAGSRAGMGRNFKGKEDIRTVGCSSVLAMSRGSPVRKVTGESYKRITFLKQKKSLGWKMSQWIKYVSPKCEG